jgi:biopolymer transport protein ExbD/biopolymer transport protein TolR
MAIEIGGPGKKTNVKPAMNITPLVDVVLVLLIIFMVVTPMLTKQFWVLIPKQEEKKVEAASNADKKPVVLSVLKDGTIKVNTDVVTKDALPEKLKRVFAARNGDHSLFFTADDEAPYGISVEAMDLARSGGATPINVLTVKPKG